MKRIMRAAMLMAAMATPAMAGDGLIHKDPIVHEMKDPQPVIADKKADDRPTLDVVFVLDTTGSMGSLIQGAKEKIWSIASRMASGKPTPRIRVGLVGYRDRGDAYETKRFDLSEDLDTVYKNLQGFQADGGGDGPEHVGKGLGEAVKFMSWSQNSKASRMIFLVGDAPPHDDYQDQWNTKVWAKNAIEKGIVVNTIRCGNDDTTMAAFQAISKLSDGSFVSIGQSGGMVAVKTPFDDEIGKLNGSLSATTVFTGSAAARGEGERNAREQAAMPSTVAADRGGYMAKNLKSFAPSAGAGSIDLAAAPEKLAEVKTEALPPPMQAMKAEERVAYVQKQAAERKEIESKLKTLTEKRSGWMAENAKGKKDSFDEQVFESVKKSAAKAGITY